MRTVADSELDTIAGQLRGTQFGLITIESASTSLYEDADGELGVLVSLVLSDPIGDSWPVDDVVQLRTHVRRAIDGAPHLGGRIYFELRPSTDEDLEEDDAPDPAAE